MPINQIKIFESASSRVKGVSFHPKRPWILASLHTGAIQLWDYRLGILLSSYIEHEGPVRSVSFHPTQSIFVSGGDDAKVKVWNSQSSSNEDNVKSSRPLFTLSGHVDYIRTVSFHSECPWILSCSDDQTIRIWNWQSRQCINILTGHNHYVMGAHFSPLGDLIASCSLDQTIRIWDITGLLKKSSATSSGGSGIYNNSRQSSSCSSNSHPDLFAPSDVTVKHIIEGHDRGVNSISWHPSGQMLISASDDRQVKVWQMDSLRAWEVDNFSGHFNNVSSAIFSYHGDIVMTNSEDRTMRVWDVRSKASLSTFKRDGDRFWSVVAHPSTYSTSSDFQMLFAAAHDSGFFVFKLEKERPAKFLIHPTLVEPSPHSVLCPHLLYVSSGCALNVAALPLEPPAGFIPQKSSLGTLTCESFSRYGESNVGRIGERPHSISYNPSDGSILAVYRSLKTPFFEYYPNICSLQQHTSLTSSPQYHNMGTLTGTFKGPGRSAVFLNRNRFVILDAEGKNLSVYSAGGKELSKRISLSFITSEMYYCNMTSVYLVMAATNDNTSRIVLFDIQQSKPVHEAPLAPSSGDVRLCSASFTSDMVAFSTKTRIFVYTKKLDRLISFMATPDFPIKSLTWDDRGTLYYSTLFHIRYVLPCKHLDNTCESNSIFQTSAPVYLAMVTNGVCYVIDRKGSLMTLQFDPSEVYFKDALERKDLRTMSALITSGDLIGQSMIAHLCKKGYPKACQRYAALADINIHVHLALKYVKDPISRFELALDCGDLDMAMSMAQQVDMETCWSRLAEESILRGRHSLAEICFVREKSHEKLLFLYVVTGQFSKIRRLQKEATVSGDVMTRCICSILLNDFLDLHHLLMESGQEALAYLAARTGGHVDGLYPETATSNDKMRSVDVFLENIKMSPTAARENDRPNPNCDQDWPINEKESSYSPLPIAADPSFSRGEAVNDNSYLASPTQYIEAAKDPGVDEMSVEAWGIEEDIGPSSVQNQENREKIRTNEIQPGVDPVKSTLLSSSSKPIDHILMGDFSSAVQLLRKQRGISLFGPLKKHFLFVYSCSRLFVPCSGLPSLMIGLLSMDSSSIIVKYIEENYAQALSLTTAGKFQDALAVFEDVLQACSLIDAKEKTKSSCRQYILGLSIELKRRTLPTVGAQSQPYAPDQYRILRDNLMLVGLFTLCDLEPVHQQLTLRMAMSTCCKYSNYKMAAYFARRLLTLDGCPCPESFLSQVKKTLSVCEQHIEKSNGNGDSVELDDWEPLLQLDYICHYSFAPHWSTRLASSNPKKACLECLYCESLYDGAKVPQNLVCPVCSLTKINSAS